MFFRLRRIGRRRNPAMPLNGLLLKLSANTRMAEAALASISSRNEVMLGDAKERWQPLVVDTSDVKEAHDFHEWLEALPGVEQVDVIFVGFDEPILTETAP
jgi:hypothetical protein